MSQPEYKDTVSSWLGEIPAAWEVRRLKTLIAQPITDGPHETPSFLPDGIPFLSVDGIQNGDLVFDGCRYISQAAHEEYQRKCAPRYNDILIGKAASTGKIARVKVDFEFSVWSPLALIRPNQPEAQPNFLEYALKNITTQAQIDCLCTANTQKNISMRDIPTLVLCVPHANKQRRIAAYLDEQTAKIDRLMDMRRRQMVLLKEQRAALIQQAVTRGLNPNAPMKDSGLPWQPDIPKSWSILQIRRLISFITSGSRGWAEFYSDEGDIFVQSGNLTRSMTLDINGAQRVQPPTGAEGERTKIAINDVLICITGALTGNVALVDFDPPTAYVNQHIALLRPRLERIEPKFMSFVLWSVSGQIQFKLAEYGGTKQGLGLNDVRHAFIAVPPLAEQRDILAFIETKTEKFNSLLSAYSRQLTLLAEYRAALIHECVTGQRPVPEPSFPAEGTAHAL